MKNVKDFFSNYRLLSGIISSLVTIGILIGVYQTKINYLTEDAAEKNAKIESLERKDQENYDKMFDYVWKNMENIATLRAIVGVDDSDPE